MTTRLTRTTRILFCLAAATLAAAPIGAETILLVVRESLGTGPLSRPLPVAEALSESLFDTGYIVFELAGPSPGSTPEQLRQIARQGGAELILEVNAVDSADTSPPLPVFSSRIEFLLTDVATGSVKARGAEELSNKGREKAVDSKGLAAEAGRLVAGRVAAALRAQPTTP